MGRRDVSYRHLHMARLTLSKALVPIQQWWRSNFTKKGMPVIPFLTASAEGSIFMVPKVSIFGKMLQRVHWVRFLLLIKCFSSNRFPVDGVVSGRNREQFEAMRNASLERKSPLTAACLLRQQIAPSTLMSHLF